LRASITPNAVKAAGPLRQYETGKYSFDLRATMCADTFKTCSPLRQYETGKLKVHFRATTRTNCVCVPSALRQYETGKLKVHFIASACAKALKKLSLERVSADYSTVAKHCQAQMRFELY